jgi:hypothetical protein
MPGYLGPRLLGLRVMAPKTVQKAALEENVGPYPRSVMKGKPLDVKNNTRNFVVFHGKTGLFVPKGFNTPLFRAVKKVLNP